MSRTYGKAQDLIDFTRASSGTALRRVKYTEKVVNGTFDSDISGWTAIDSTLSNVSGQLRISATGSFGRANQSFATEIGKLYKVSGVSTFVSGTNRSYIAKSDDGASLNAVVSGTTSDPAGIKEFFFSATATTTYISLGVSVSGSVADFDNVSVKEVTFDTSDGDLILFNHPDNIPRIEYDANGNLLGLLVEESRTNLVTYSDDFEQSIWSKTNATATKNIISSPDGAVSGNKITANDVNTWHGVHLPFAGISVTAGTAYSFTVFAKAGEYSWLQIGSSTPAFNGTYANINLQNGEVGNSNTTPTVTSVGNGWYKISITETCILSHSNGSFFIAMYDNDVASRLPSYSGSSSSGLYVWRAMFEAGSFPTSAIPTSGSTATRSADVASLSTSAFGYRQDEGSVVVEASGLSPITGQYVFDIHDNTSSEQIYLRLDSTSIGRGVVIDGGSVVFNADATGSTPNANTFVKYGYAASNNDFAITANGSTPNVDSLGTMPTVTKLTIGGREVSTGYLNGHIKSLKYYPRRLTNAQLQELTS